MCTILYKRKAGQMYINCYIKSMRAVLTVINVILVTYYLLHAFIIYVPYITTCRLCDINKRIL